MHINVCRRLHFYPGFLPYWLYSHIPGLVRPEKNSSYSGGLDYTCRRRSRMKLYTYFVKKTAIRCLPC